MGTFILFPLLWNIDIYWYWQSNINVAISHTVRIVIIHKFFASPGLKLHQAIVEAVSDVSGICVPCSFFADSTAEGCTVKLKNDQHSFVFNISRFNNEEGKLDCFPVPQAGVYSVYTYETNYGVHICDEHQNITLRQSESEYINQSQRFTDTMNIAIYNNPLQVHWVM